ncbi:glycine cleavage system aminomethyltransferase GcvT [Desertivirga arenae]|uniref:glycine cleavage system aminomethyltransferase GcvT n=1 Tax=Desertivirga arenae TaxID=2810309 RepID=UPI001A976BC0|nr:glycine cleavage system aminomethyltransferase GcvT [Pedobacter sp. SYSU D00823]
MKELVLNEIHIALGAKMSPFAGYSMPVMYSGIMEEHHAVRNSLGIFDVSHMGEFILEGEGSLELIQRLTTNDASVLTPGDVQYSCMTNEKGGIVDDLLVYCLEAGKYMLVVNASNIEKDWNWISERNAGSVKMTNISDSTVLLAVQGPVAATALQSLTPVPLAQMKYYTFTKGQFAGIDDVIISATGYTGAGGFELYCKNEDAERLWQAVMEAGKPYEIKAAGLGARDTLRLEMGYCLYGNDINDETSPIEAGLGWITKFSKEFPGSDHFKEQKKNGIEKKLCGFEIVGKGFPRRGYKVLDEHFNEVGVVTSASISPSLDKSIGLAYLNKSVSAKGTPIKVVVRDKALDATVCSLPFTK